MKRLILSSILTATLIMASILTPDYNISNAVNGVTASAEAAVTNPIKSDTPTLKATARTATTVTLKTGSVSKASGYLIYRATSAEGGYKYIGYTTTGSYTDKGLKSSGNYYYKAKAYITISGTKYYSKSSKVAGVTSAMSKPAQILAQSTASKSATVAWSSVSGAVKYYVYRGTSVNGTYKYIGTSTCTSYTDTNLTAGKTYYYKVRGIKTSNGVKYYSAYSGKASVTVKGSAAKGTPTPTPTPTPTTGGSSNDTNTSDSSFASQVLKIVNQERAKAGVSPLTISQQLVAPANKRAKEIKESFSHTRPDGTAWNTVLAEFNVSVSAAGENIAYNFNTPEAVMTAWMNSEGHRANILSTKYGHIGIGVYEVNGTVYCEQLFSN